MKLTPVEVQHVKLSRRLLGYDRGDVERLLEDVTSSYEEVWLERDGLRAELEQVRKELERSRENERLVGDALVRAQRIAETTIADAKSTAEALLSEAREQADELTREVRAEPARVREEISRLQAVESGLHARLREFLVAAERLLEGGTDGDDTLGKLALRVEPAANGASGAANAAPSGSEPLG